MNISDHVINIDRKKSSFLILFTHPYFLFVLSSSMGWRQVYFANALLDFHILKLPICAAIMVLLRVGNYLVQEAKLICNELYSLIICIFFLRW